MKPRLLGHWGTTPSLNFVYAHMHRLIRACDLSAIFIAGPGHGGPGVERHGHRYGLLRSRELLVPGLVIMFGVCVLVAPPERNCHLARSETAP